ncbi:hypothetical protein MAXJ12_24137 [Mesorhizobium alhagi CCNWXJ12-2]|uniref:Uncharacterized protein n=1 Tax=Mesorhizobium alhagi CCNWXJ12-2 TaxID=1107882 RepID=H0HXA8_9HYPH|nr:hypothetical protein MAXJ12_24137 [Mesorhizobium alhagi CCNWXJ12-2]
MVVAAERFLARQSRVATSRGVRSVAGREEEPAARRLAVEVRCTEHSRSNR